MSKWIVGKTVRIFTAFKYLTPANVALRKKLFLNATSPIYGSATREKNKLLIRFVPFRSVNSSLPSWQVMNLAWKWSCLKYIYRNEAVKRQDFFFLSPFANESVRFIFAISTSVLFMTQFSMEVQKVKDFAFFCFRREKRRAFVMRLHAMGMFFLSFMIRLP